MHEAIGGGIVDERMAIDEARVPLTASRLVPIVPAFVVLSLSGDVFVHIAAMHLLTPAAAAR